MSDIRRSFVGAGRDRCHLLEAGEGTKEGVDEGVGTIVFFPAVGDSAHSYAGVLVALADALSGGVRVAAVDPPGYGRAILPAGEIPTFSELMRWAGAFGDAQPGPILLVGNSSGGAMATAAAVANPETTRGLVLCGWPDWRVARMPMDTLLPGDRDELQKLLKHSFHQPPSMPPDMADMLLMRYTSAQFQAHVRSLPADEVREGYDAYSGPLLFVGGSGDGLVPPRALRDSAARRPAAAVHILQECGHFPHRERMGQLVEVLSRFATAHLDCRPA